MSEILRNECPKRELYTLSILVISIQSFCNKLSEALHTTHKYKGYSYKLSTIKAEKISEILEFTSRIHVDFVVFVLDTSNTLCVKEVESNLQLMDSFLCGRICIVNGTPYKLDVTITLNLINTLRLKYNIPLINGDVMNAKKCLLLAERILILANSTCNQGSPYIPWLFS